jgi:hypothetical protein
MKKPSLKLRKKEREIVATHYDRCWELDVKNRKPSSDAERHFLLVCRGKADPSTDLEKAWIKLKSAVSIYRPEKKVKKRRRIGPQISDSMISPNTSVVVNPSFFARLPLPEETCAFCSLSQVKRAALLFDRLFVPSHVLQRDREIPADLTFCSDRMEWDAFDAASQIVQERFLQRHFGNREVSEEEAEIFWDQLHGNREFNEALEREHNACLRFWFAEHLNVYGVSLFDDEDDYDLTFPGGSAIAYKAALCHLPIVTEKGLSWEQVLGFREDMDAQRKYRNLRLWLFEGIRAKSLQHATDLIGKKIEDYEWAIQKHSLKTSRGVLNYVLKPLNLLATSAAAGLGALLTGEIWSALTGGGLLITSQIATLVAEKRIDRKEAERGRDSEVAVIYEAQQLLKKAQRRAAG